MRALVVDDVPSMRHFLAMCLAEFRGLEIDQASDGMQALKLVTENSYDVILLDLNLPLLHGFKVLRSLRERNGPNQGTPVFIISTTFDDEARSTAAELSAQYLPKPVRAFDVRDKVRSLLSLPEPTPPVGADKRREPRLRIPIQVALADLEPIDLISEDINALGAFIVCQEPMPAVGSTGKITLSFPHLEQPIEVDCRVVHVRELKSTALPNGFGVRFEPSSPELSARLARAFVSPEGQ